MGSYIVPIIPLQSVDAFGNKTLGGYSDPPNLQNLKGSRHTPCAVSLIVVGTLMKIKLLIG